MPAPLKKISVGILGAAGYTGGELIRLLLLHPHVEIAWAVSKSNSGNKVSAVHTDLFGDTDMEFCAGPGSAVDVVFLCMGHGESAAAVAGIDKHTRIIDLSQDYRLGGPKDRPFVYGLCEVNRETIANAQNIANPGCFATAIQLALAPLAHAGLLPQDITAVCTTGSTGAGQSLSKTSHFSYRDNNLSVYKPFTHQHLAEIDNTLGRLQPGFGQAIHMFPQRGAFPRGILACISMKIGEQSLDTIHNIIDEYYAGSSFVFRTSAMPDLKQVVNTNKCLLYAEVHNCELLIVSVIDNLLKGASGQAVQNMNIMMGLPEQTGLKLKASAF